MKIRMTVTVELEDTAHYSPEGEYEGEVEREDVGQHLLEAVSCWGGQYWPDHVFTPTNIKCVKVTGCDFHLDSEIQEMERQRETHNR